MRFRDDSPARAAPVWLLSAAVLWSVVAVFWPPAGWLVLPTLVLAVVGAAADYRSLRSALAGAAIRRRIPTPVARDKPFRVTLEISIPGGLAWSAEVRQELPGPATPNLWIEAVEVPGSGDASLSRWIRVPIRGRYPIGLSGLPARSARFARGQRPLGTTEEIDVYPESTQSKEALAKDAADEMRLLDKLRQSQQRGVGTEFESLSDYRPGDDPRRVDWRLSAKYRRLIVRRYQIERHRDLIVLVDSGRLMGADAGAGTKLDCAVDAALRLIRTALRVGDRCGLGIFDNEVRVICGR